MYDGMLTIGGNVGNDVDFVDNGGTALAVFRLASTPRRFDRSTGSWHDQETVWLTVKAWRNLAHNIKASVCKGEPVIVTGRLRASRWKDEDGQEHTRTFVEAVAVGHDLNRGTSAYHKSERAAARNEAVDQEAMLRRAEATESSSDPAVTAGAA